MKIAVCVKAVPEAVAMGIDAATMRLNRTVPLVLNSFDANAVEEALRLKETLGEGEVLVLSLGPAAAREALTKALAMGADRAVLISDAGAVGSDLVATSYVLGRVLEGEAVDLVIFGQQAADADGAVLWAAVADRLRFPVVSQVSELTVVEGSATARRQTEFGYERIEVQLPAVISVSDAINEARYPSLRGIMGAKKKPYETVSLTSLGVDPKRAGRAGSHTVVYSLADPPRRTQGMLVEDDGHGAERIVEFLAERRLLA